MKHPHRLKLRVAEKKCNWERRKIFGNRYLKRNLKNLTNGISGHSGVSLLWHT